MKKNLIAIALLPLILTGCDFDDDPNTGSGTDTGTVTPPPPPIEGEGEVYHLFGASADTGYGVLIVSASDGYAGAELTEGEPNGSLTDISATLINNEAMLDAVDVQMTGPQAGMFMLQVPGTLEPRDFSPYAAGFLEFKVRSTSTIPASLTLAIDNDWPNRKVFELSTHLNYTNDWQEVSVPVNCIKADETQGLQDFSLSSVKTPFYLESNLAYDFEITDIVYKQVSKISPVVNASTCAAN